MCISDNHQNGNFFKKDSDFYVENRAIKNLKTPKI